MAFNTTILGIEKDSRPLPRCILFDAVGTLIYASPSVAEVYQTIGRRHGLDLSADDLQHRFATAFAGAFGQDTATDARRELLRWRAIVGDIFHEIPAAVDGLFDELWRHFARSASWRLYDDAPTALADLQAAGFRLGIASNFDDRLAGVCRGHAPLCELPVFCASDVGFTKPDLRFFDAIARQIGWPPEQILLVGDHPDEDVRGARDAGWQAMLIDRRQEKLTSSGSVAGAVSSLVEVASLLAADRPR